MNYSILKIFALIEFFSSEVHPFSTSYRGYKLFRVSSASDGVLQYLNELELNGHHFTSRGERMPLVDIWAESGRNVDVSVAPELAKHFAVEMIARGADRVEMLKNDLQKNIDEERRKRKRRNRRSHNSQFAGHDSNAKAFDLFTYNRYNTILAYLAKVVKTNPELTELLNITKTFEGRDLVGIKIRRKSLLPKPAFFIDAGIHAREWIAPAAALYLINTLVLTANSKPYAERAAANSSSSSSSKSNSHKHRHSEDLLDQFDFIIFPVANPDGYEYSMTKDRFWRKTRSRNITVNKWCVGVDANRNWGYRWGENGANHSPCSNIYAGSSAFSEPEVKAIRNFVSKQLPNLTVYASLHSYGQFFLSPWGWTEEKPDNYSDQKMAAKSAVEAIRKVTGSSYSYGTIAELMYPASGTSIDYMQHLGVPYIYGIELRPEDVDNNQFGFTIPPEYIEPTGIEMIAAINGIARYLSAKRSHSDKTQ